MLRLDLQLVRALAKRVDQLGVSSKAAWDSLQIDRPPVLNGGLHLDLGVLQWSKLVEFGRHKLRQKTNPN